MQATKTLRHVALDSLLDFAVGMEKFLGWDQVGFYYPAEAFDAFLYAF